MILVPQSEGNLAPMSMSSLQVLSYNITRVCLPTKALMSLRVTGSHFLDEGEAVDGSLALM